MPPVDASKRKSRNVLLTLGRMPKGLDLARGLSRAGHRVFVADPHKRHICRYSNTVTEAFQVTPPNVSAQTYTEDLLDIVTRCAIDTVIPVSEESVYAAAVADALPAGVTFFGPGFETARALHDKFQFNRSAAAQGLGVPETALLGSPEAAALAATTDVIVKPRHASAGIGVTTVDRGTPLPATTARPSLVQRKLTGRLVTTFSVAINGRCLATSVYEGAIFAGSVAIAFARADGSAGAETWAAAFIEKTGYTGFISFDMFIDENGGAAAIECNPRLTSGIHLLETADIAEAIFADGAIPIRQRPRNSFQHFWPCLGVTELSIFKGADVFRRNLRTFLGSADVTWDRADPVPFLMMNFCSGEILRKCLFGGMSLGEATIDDVEWREPEAGSGAIPVSATVPGT